MELFKQDGHFTSEGIHALVNGTLNDTQSLEAAEHLSFCDACLETYLHVLEGGELLAPSQPLREPVLRRLKRKARQVLFSRYATVAAAAVIAVGIYSSGILNRFESPEASAPVSPPVVRTNNSIRVDEEIRQSYSTRMNDALDNVGGSISGFFSSLFSGGQNQSTAESQKPRGSHETDKNPADTSTAPAESTPEELNAG